MDLKYLIWLPLILMSCTGYSPLLNDEEQIKKEEEEEVVSSITPEMGGSNYTFVDLGRYAADPTEENWLSDIRTPVTHFSQLSETIKQQLDTIIRNGQKKIAIVVWFGGPGLICDTYAHTVCPHNGKMPASVKNNLQRLLTEVANREFSEVQIRLAGQGTADIFGWDSFNQLVYNSNESFIDDVITVSEEALSGYPIKVYYDLGLELMGHPYVVDRPWVKEYLVKIWSHYIQKFDSKKTIGFSFNHAHREATYESLKIFDDSGIRPPILGFDIYVDRDKHFQNIKLVLALKGWPADYPIFIQETYRSDAQVASEIKKAITDLKLNIRTIMQWPLDQGGSGHANSVDYTFDNYK